jgi:hypothetical protein
VTLRKLKHALQDFFMNGKRPAANQPAIAVN